MATLTVTASEDYTDGDPSLGSEQIDQILFQNNPPAAVTFGSNQFGTGPGLIANNVTITGNAFANNVFVNLSSAGIFSAASWTVTADVDVLALNGTTGDDTITGSSHGDQITGGAGSDSIDGGEGNDNIAVTDGAHLAAGETYEGGNGTDQLTVLSSNNPYDLSVVSTNNIEKLNLSGFAIVTLLGSQFAGSGFTTIDGNHTFAQSLTINGNVDLSGVTFIDWGNPGSAQTITIIGTASGDLLTGSVQNDSISGGTGFDTINGGLGNETIGGGDQGDLIFGQDGNDLINGGMGLDTIDGGIDNDTIIGGLGGDSIAGNLGVDQLHGGDGDDTLGGGDQGDHLFGELGNDVLNGGMGLDTIDGGAGNDVITGGLGNDSLTGGEDADIFAFNTPVTDGIDTISDFVSGTDMIRVAAAGYGGGLVAGHAVTLVMASSSAAANSGSGGYFILDNSGASLGNLYWDANGGNGGDAVQIAVLTGITSLQVDDFLVV